MNSDMVYHKNEPKIWNTESFVNPKVVSCYVKIHAV